MKYDNDHDVTNLLWTSSCRPPALQQTTYLTPSFSGPLLDMRGHFRRIWVIPTQSKALSIKIDFNSHSKCDFYPHFHQQCHCSAAGQFRDIGCVSFKFFFDNNPVCSVLHHKTGGQKNYSTAKHYNVQFSALKILKEIVPELTCGCGSDGLQHMTGCCGGELPLLSAEYN